MTDGTWNYTFPHNNDLRSSKGLWQNEGNMACFSRGETSLLKAECSSLQLQQASYPSPICLMKKKLEQCANPTFSHAALSPLILVQLSNSVCCVLDGYLKIQNSKTFPPGNSLRQRGGSKSQRTGSPNGKLFRSLRTLSRGVPPPLESPSTSPPILSAAASDVASQGRV